MDMWDKVFSFAAAIFVLYGLGGLVATWIWPRLQRSWIFAPWMLTGALKANDFNRTTMSLFVLIFGIELGLSVSGQRTLRLVALALLLAIVIVRVAYARHRPDA